MNTNTIKVYEILKDYWGENKASVVLDYLENETTLKVERTVEDKIEHLATREDILELKTATREDILELKTATREDILKLETATREDILKLETATREDILKLGTATREDILKLETATREDIFKLEKAIFKMETTIVDKYAANTIKWMFVFWIGTMGTIIAIIKLL